MKLAAITLNDGRRVDVTARQERCGYYHPAHDRAWVIEVDGREASIAPQLTLRQCREAIDASWGWSETADLAMEPESSVEGRLRTFRFRADWSGDVYETEATTAEEAARRVALAANVPVSIDAADDFCGELELVDSPNGIMRATLAIRHGRHRHTYEHEWRELRVFDASASGEDPGVRVTAGGA